MKFFSHEFLWQTWSGRIAFVNLVVFLNMIRSSGSVWMPDPETIIAFGAKDPVLLATGEGWRVLTNIFEHIGFLHFLMNMAALKNVGPQIEEIAGRNWFLLVYLLSGVCGSLISNEFSLSVSAGASGSIMGLLGFGLFVEWQLRRRVTEITGKSPKLGVYFINTVFIVLLGLTIPNIDNAAHIGGLLVGFAVGFVVLCVKPNRLLKLRKRTGAAILVAIILLTAFLFSRAVDDEKIYARYAARAETAESLPEKWYSLTQLSRMRPTDMSVRLKRLQIMIDGGEFDMAVEEVAECVKIGCDQGELNAYFGLLELDGRKQLADRLRDLLPSTQH